MLNGIAKKECRECLPLFVCALLLAVLALLVLIRAPLFPWRARGIPYAIPFVADDFIDSLAIYCADVAVIFGLRQSIFEHWYGTYCFLLHRPSPRNSLFATKLTIGVVFVLLLSVTPILLYAWWASSPSKTPTPFVWSMTYPAWNVAVVTPTVYLGAFLCGVHNTISSVRLLSLVAAFAASTVCLNLLNAFEFVWGWALLTIVNAFLLIGIFYAVNRQDY